MYCKFVPLEYRKHIQWFSFLIELYTVIRFNKNYFNTISFTLPEERKPSFHIDCPPEKKCGIHKQKQEKQ